MNAHQRRVKRRAREKGRSNWRAWKRAMQQRHPPSFDDFRAEMMEQIANAFYVPAPMLGA